jgi:hypothetical protein
MVQSKENLERLYIYVIWILWFSNYGDYTIELRNEISF